MAVTMMTVACKNCGGMNEKPIRDYRCLCSRMICGDCNTPDAIGRSRPTTNPPEATACQKCGGTNLSPCGFETHYFVRRVWQKKEAS